MRRSGASSGGMTIVFSSWIFSSSASATEADLCSWALTVEKNIRKSSKFNIVDSKSYRFGFDFLIQ